MTMTIGRTSVSDLCGQIGRGDFREDLRLLQDLHVGVGQPAGRAEGLGLPASLVRIGSFISPVISSQSRPPDGSGRILPSAILSAAAVVDHLLDLQVAGEFILPGLTEYTTTRTAMIASQISHTFG